MFAEGRKGETECPSPEEVVYLPSCPSLSGREKTEGPSLVQTAGTQLVAVLPGASSLFTPWASLWALGRVYAAESALSPFSTSFLWRRVAGVSPVLSLDR